MGRPISYPTVVTPEILTRIETMAECGCKVSIIAADFAICENTFKKWRDLEPTVDEAYKRGKQKGDGKILKTAYDLALSGDKTMLCFLMKTRLGMSERPVIDMSSAKLNKIIDIIINTVKDPDELKEIESKMRQEIDVNDDGDN